MVRVELDSQAPRIQVFTPKRGSNHACSTIQTARMASGIRISINLPPLFSLDELGVMGFAPDVLRLCSIPFYLTRERNFCIRILPRAIGEVIMFTWPLR